MEATVASKSLQENIPLMKESKPEKSNFIHVTLWENLQYWQLAMSDVTTYDLGKIYKIDNSSIIFNAFV